MFIFNLNTEQQGVLLGLAKQLIEADSVISQHEEAFMKTIQAQMEDGVTPNKAVSSSLCK